MTADQERLRQFPKDLYFNAEDHALGPNALPDSRIDVIRSRRLADFRRLCTVLEDLHHAAKNHLKSFDRQGNIGMAAANLNDAALEAQKVLANHTRDIAQAEERFREAASHNEESPTPPPAPSSAVEPSPQVPADDGPKPEPKPKPGPGLVSVVVPAPSLKPLLTDEAFSKMKAQKDLERGVLPDAAAGGMASVFVFNPDQSPEAQLSAFDRVIAARAANTRFIR